MMRAQLFKILLSVVLACSFHLKYGKAHAQKSDQTPIESQTYSPKLRNREVVKPHSDSSLDSKKDNHPFNITLVFAQARLDYKSDRYGRMQGLLLKARYEWYTSAKNRVRLLYSYSGQQESVAVTPSLADLNQSPEQDDSQDLGVSSSYTYLNRPKLTQETLGWTQNMALGLQWHQDYTESSAIAMSIGVNSQFVNQIEPNLSPWICLESQWRYLWLSLNYQGDPCQAINHARSRFLMGMSLGRAKLGLGWGLSRLEQHNELLKTDLKDGGVLAWLSLPLNAAIYLEMSLAFTEASKLWLDKQNESGALSAFMVGLTWTGEQEIKELEAPKRNLNPKGTQSQPISPSQPTTSPSSQPLFTPNPLQPSSPPNSPSTPL